MFNEYRPLLTKSFWVKFFSLLKEFLSPDAIAERIDNKAKELEDL